MFYKTLGKKIVFTAHNINIRERDGKNSWFYQKSLSFMYRKMDHIFVHTAKNKNQLVKDFKIKDNKISVIPFGINNVIPKTEIKRGVARETLGLNDQEKVVLFFGNIAPYKGLEFLLKGFSLLKNNRRDYRLIIAGRVKGCDDYWRNLLQMSDELRFEKLAFTSKPNISPTDEVEIYFKAADLLVLPYRTIFQSGVLFWVITLAYRSLPPT